MVYRLFSTKLLVIWTNIGLLLVAYKFQWSIKQNTTIFPDEGELENVVCKLAAICLGLIVLIGYAAI